MSERREHPDLEILAAFVDGTLGRDEARAVVRHLASCEECSHMVAETARYRDDRSAARVVRPRRFAVLAGSIAASVLLALSVWMLRSRLPGHEQPGVLRGTGPLVSALAERRPVDARISGGFEWAPLEPFERSGAGPRSTPTWELLSAASAIQKEAETKPTPENLHALGVANLVLGDLDSAVSVLRRIAREPDADAKTLSDLGAALLERGERKGRADDLMEALSVIEDALRKSPSLEEALFNRAVAFEKLHLDERAAEAWRAYLVRAPLGGWADEAKRRLSRLEAPKETGSWQDDRRRIEQAIASGDRKTVDEIVSRRTQETRLWVEDELLGAWAESARAGRVADAEKTLGVADELAQGLVAAVGDPTTRDAVAQVKSADGATRATLIRALLAYREGTRRYAEFDIDGAYERFDEARELLSPLGGPSAQAASYAFARCLYYHGAHARARAMAFEVLREAERDGYRARIAHARWLVGLIDLVDGRLGDALTSYRVALDGFRSLREEGYAAFLAALLGEAKGMIGDEPESLRLALDGVGGIRRATASQAVVILTVCGMAAARGGYADAALAFQGGAVDRARKDGDAVDVADSLIRRATIALDAGRPEGVEKDVEDLQAWRRRVTDPSARLRLEAEGGYVEARLARTHGKPLEAAAALGETISYFRSTGMLSRLPIFYAERARAYEGAGNTVAARHDLEAGIEVFEGRRKGLPQDRERVSYFDGARDLFDQLASLEIENGHPERALAALERGKTRELLDRAGATETASLDTPLPQGVTVVEYGVLQDRLLVWAMSGGTRELTQQSVAASDLAVLVGSFREALERRGPASDSDSGERLRKILVDPIADRIRDNDTIVFVPDQVLHAVPFAALPSPGGRFLVEDHAIVIAPSLSLFRRASQRATRETGAQRTLFAIGDPAFDTAAFPNLPRLSRAASEVEQISRLYADAVVLTGESATPQRFLDGIEGRTVLHVAAHALGNDADPDLSRLMLAADPDRHDSGVLFAGDLYGRRFDSVQVVVLAACDTASGKISRAEGPLSLARPFLAGGVPSVVATLWEIEDTSSAELLVRFHRGIASGQRPDEALRDAQIALIQGSDEALREPRVWAAFEVVGGTSAGVAGKEI